MTEKKDFTDIGNIFKARVVKKAPAYKWQDLALRIITELNVPNFKRSSVFKACRDNDTQFILNCLNDTKELCQSKSKWQYFFKVVSNKNSEKKEEITSPVT